MPDWFRSFGALAAALLGVAVVTFGLAGIIVPGGAAGGAGVGGGGDGDDDGPTPAPTVRPLEGIGGDLVVTGDREGILRLLRESSTEVYALEGDDARMVVEDVPPVITQISWEGLEFFPEPSDCTITPGELDDRIGVGYAEVSCTGLEDVRGGGTVNMSGSIGLPLTTIGESDLPDMGGSVTVGGETWEFTEAFLFEFPVSRGPFAEDETYSLALRDPERDGRLGFDYDFRTHRLTLVNVEHGDDDVDLDPGACSLTTVELGRLTPQAAVVEVTIQCPAAEVPGLGTVPISGTVIVQQLGFRG